VKYDHRSRRVVLRPSPAGYRTGILTQTDLSVGAATKPTRVAILRRNIPLAVRWSFLLYVSVLPLDVIDLGFITMGFSLPKFFGLLMVGCFFFYFNPVGARSLPAVPTAMWWFLAYITIYAIHSIFIPAEARFDLVVRLITLVQLVVFFWIASDLLRDEMLVRNALISYSAVCFVFSIAIILQLPVLSVTTSEGRVSALGENENALAGIMAVAVLTLVGLALSNSFSRFASKMMLILLALPPLMAMVSTGSRGVMLAFVAASLVYVLPNVSFERKITGVVLGLFCVAGLAFMVRNNPDVLERWYQTFYEGKMSTREDIIPPAIEMISERPLFGWHPIEYSYELGSRLAKPSSDPHNTYLFLLLEVGIVGAVNVLAGWLICGRGAWRARTGELGFLPLSLFVAMIVHNLSGTILTAKLLWFILALSVAAGFATSNRSQRRHLTIRTQSISR
jgi:O-antigen ligase